MAKLRPGNPGEPTERMDQIVTLAGAGFPEEDFAKLDLTHVPWWVDKLRQAEAECRLLRHRLLQLVEAEPVRQCDGCHGPIAGRADRRFCSSGCRQRAYRQRTTGTSVARQQKAPAETGADLQ